MINFYHMEGCHHCVTAKTELQTKIDAGEIRLLSQKDAPQHVKGFPYFELVDANNNVLKTSTGWSSKQNLYNNLGLAYIETYDNYEFGQNYQDPNQQNYLAMNYPNYDQNYHDPNYAQTYHDPNYQNYIAMNDPNYAQNYDMNHQKHHNMFPVVEHMETVSTDVLYHHRTGGYSKLSNCWVKQPDYTA